MTDACDVIELAFFLRRESIRSGGRLWSAASLAESEGCPRVDFEGSIALLLEHGLLEAVGGHYRVSPDLKKLGQTRFEALLSSEFGPEVRACLDQRRAVTAGGVPNGIRHSGNNPGELQRKPGGAEYDESPLRHLGYKVGKSGLDREARREFLEDFARCAELPGSIDAAIRVEWGAGASAMRIGRIISHLQNMALRMEQRNPRLYAASIEDWREDAAWVERERERLIGT